MRVERRDPVRLRRRHGQALADVIQRAFADPADARLRGMECGQQQVPRCQVPRAGASAEVPGAWCGACMTASIASRSSGVATALESGEGPLRASRSEWLTL